MKKFSCILILIFSFLAVAAQQGDFSMEKIIKTPPSPAKLVNDYAGILTHDQNEALENKLVQLDNTTFTQICVVIVPSLNGYDVADAAIELGRSWKVGNKTNNSGVVLLISKNDRKLNISPGYGLEGALTDAESNDIIQDIIKPNFKGDDYYRGIDQGTDAIIKAVKDEYKTPRQLNSKGSGGAGKFIIIIIIILFLLFARGGGGGGGSMIGPMILGNLLGGGGRSSGGWGGGGSGGGGGFGGFGGGSFGGGGSSGSW